VSGCLYRWRYSAESDIQEDWAKDVYQALEFAKSDYEANGRLPEEIVALDGKVCFNKVGLMAYLGAEYAVDDESVQEMDAARARFRETIGKKADQSANRFQEKT
jgi:hypothetical protein